MKTDSKLFIYVCTDYYNDQLISVEIAAKTEKIAKESFNKTYLRDPTIILGPFIKKKSNKSSQTIKFLNNNFKKAVYNEWIVNAFLLTEPIDHAYLVFIKRVDEKNLPYPKGIVTVPLQNLRFLNE